MSLCNAVALAIVLAQPAPPPPPPALTLTAAEDAVLRPLVAKWSAARPFPASPLVVTVESFPYATLFEPALRLELLRHSVDATTTEALLESIRKRNAEVHAIEAAALAQTTRIRWFDILLKGMDKRTMDDPSLRNLGGVVALAVPGTSGDLGMVFYNVGPQMLNTMFKGAHVALVRGGRVEWDTMFWKYPPESVTTEKFAKLSANEVAVVRTLVDAHVPDRTKRVLLVNEADLLFLPKPDLGRPVEMVLRERFGATRAADLGGTAAVVLIKLPKIDGNNATLGYGELVPKAEWIEVRHGTASFQRSGDGWTLTRDDVHSALSTAPPDPNLPVRVGGDVKAPVAVKRVRPNYPPGTRLVFAEIVVGADAKIKDIHFLTPVSPELERLAREALAQWELKPGTLNGKPVAVIWNVTLQ